MGKYNILFCETYYDGTVGGSHSTLYNTVKQLGKDKFNVNVIFYGDNIYVEKMKQEGVNVDIINLDEKSRSKNIIVRKLENLLRFDPGNQRRTTSYLTENKIDLLIINNTLYRSSQFIHSTNQTNIPIIIYERGLNTYSKNELQLSRHVFASIPMSDAIHKTLVDQQVRSKRITRIYDGIDFEKVKVTRNRSDVLRELQIPDKARVVGMVGNVKPWKGQEFFVSAAITLSTKFDDFYALIIGGCADRDQAYLSQLKAAVDSAGLNDRIIFTDYRDDIPDLLNVLDVFVHASTRPEPFGMVVPEAMAARVPVIATNFGGPVESLEKGRCGILVPPEDAAAIADGIIKYFNDEKYKMNVVDLAYQRCADCFDLAKNVVHFQNVCLEAIESGERGMR